MFGNVAAQYDVRFGVNVGTFRADMDAVRVAAREGYGAISTASLKAATIEEKYERALARTKVGSLAANRATLAYRKEVEALRLEQAGVVASSSRSGGRASGTLASEERGVGRFVRGGISSSGLFGRAATFASSAFLGGAGLAFAAKTVISRAEEEQVALSHLQVALHNAGLARQRYTATLEEAATAQEHASGFAKADINEALARNVTRYGDVQKAIRATADAEDVARQKGISLADAQNIMNRASFGNARSARQLAIQFVASTANVDKLKATTEHYTASQLKAAKAADTAANAAALQAAIEAKYHGAAARYLQTTAGKQALFNAELHDTEATIGQALLPTFNHYLGTLTSWLGKAQNQKKIQHDVNVAVHAGGTILHDVGGILKTVTTLTGGFKNALELLIALKFASTASRWANAIGGIGGAAKLAAAETTVATGVMEGELAAVGTASTVAAGEVGGLRAALLGLGAPEVLAAIATVATALQIQDFLHDHADGSGHQHAKAFLEHPLRTLKGNQAGDVIANLNGGIFAAPAGSAEAKLLEDAVSGKKPLTKAEEKQFVDEGNFFKSYADYKDRSSDYGRKDTTYLKPPVSSGPLRPRQQSNARDGYGAQSRAGSGSSADGYRPTGVALLRRRLDEANASGNQAAIRAAASALLAYDIAAAAFAKKRLDSGRGTPGLEQQYEQVLADESSQRSTIEGIDQTNQAAAKSAADARKQAVAEKARKTREARKRAEADAKKHRQAFIKVLDSVPDDLKIALNLAKTEQQKLAANRAELKALQEQLTTLRQVHAGRDAIEKNRLAQSVIQKRIDAITKKAGGTTSGADARANESQFLSDFADITSKFSPNAFPGRQGGKAETHLYELVHETRRTNGHLATIVAKHAFPASAFNHEAAGAVYG